MSDTSDRALLMAFCEWFMLKQSRNTRVWMTAEEMLHQETPNAHDVGVFLSIHTLRAEVDDPGCSMHARTDLNHGVGGHCAVRNEPCPPACLRLSLQRREQEAETLRLNLARVTEERDRAQREWADAQSQLAALEVERDRVRDELEAEEEANKHAAHTVQKAYERECERLRAKLSALREAAHAALALTEELHIDKDNCGCLTCRALNGLRIALAASEED